MANFKATVTDNEGNSYNVDVNVPQFAFEKTLEDIKENLSKSKDINEKTKTSIEQLVKDAVNGKKSKDSENLVDNLEKWFKKQQTASRKPMGSQVGNAILDNMEKDFRRVGNAVTSLTTVLISAGAVASTFLIKGFTNLGEGLKTLTDVGGAFGDSIGGVGVSAEENILSLNKLGFTTGQAVEVLGNYSRTMAILGQSSVVGATKSFLDLSDGGIAFGSTLADATEFLQEDLMFRTMMLRRDQINNDQAVRDSIRLNKNLRMFSSLLGINGDELKKNAQNVIDGNTAFKAYASSLTNGQSVIAGAEMLATGLFGSLGEAGQQVANGLLTISATGVGAIDNFVNELNPLAPGVARVVEDVAKGLRSGRITQQNANQAILRITEEFANVDPSTINRLIPIISGVGGELEGTADILVQGFINAGNSVDKLRTQLDMPIEFSNTQDGLNRFQNIVSKAQGALSSFQNAIAIGASEGLEGLSKLLDTAMTNQKFAEMLTNAGREFGNVFNNFIMKMGGADKVIAKVSTGLSVLLEEGAKLFDSILNGFLDDKGNIQIYQGFVNMVAQGLVAALKLGLAAIKEALYIVFTNPGVLASVVGGFVSLFAVSSLIRGVTTALSVGFMRLLTGPAATKAIVGALVKMGAISTTSTLATTTLGTTAATVAAGAGGAKGLQTMGSRFAGAGKMVSRATPYLAGAMVLKDGFDVVAGTDGGASGKNIGGTIGGALGALGFLAGPLGGAIGMAAGNYLGGKLGELVAPGDKKDKSDDTVIGGHANMAYKEAVLNITARSMAIHINEPTLVRLVNPVMSQTQSLNATPTRNISTTDVVTASRSEIDKANEIMQSGTDPKNYTPAQKDLVDKVNSSTAEDKTILLMLLTESKKQNKYLSEIADKPSD